MTVVTITSSQSWTCPAGVTKVDVVLVGGGGSGHAGSDGTPSNIGVGGPSGTKATPNSTSASSLVPGASYPIVIGAGGLGSPSYTAGGTTTAFGLSGAGGAHSGGNAASGQDGGPGQAGYSTGVSSSAGEQGEGSTHGEGGAAAEGYGASGGGGGGGSYFSAGGQGGAGAPGVVVITYVVPTVTIDSVTPASGTAPLSVAFACTGTGTPTGYSWAFGDGNTSGDEDPTHIYTVTGIKTATVTVYNYYGFAQDSEAVTVYWLPSSRGQIISSDGRMK